MFRKSIFENKMLTGFQLRAGRGILDVYAKDMAKDLGLHTSTLIRLEEKTPNLSYLKCNLRTLTLIINYYEQYGITFPNKNAISLKMKNTTFAANTKSLILTRFQLKAARIATRLTQKRLGEILDIAQSTISSLEAIEDNISFIKCREKIRIFFSKNGIFFPHYDTVELLDDPVTLLEIHTKLFDIE